MKRSTASVLTLTLLVSTGCFKLARTSPPVERYVLGGARLVSAEVTPREATMRAATVGEAAVRDSGAISLGLRRLELAPYLATLAIVVRRADNEIITSGFHRWAEGPSAGLNRAVSGYLALTPGIRSVDVAPWPIRSAHDFIVQLHVARLEGVAPADHRATQGEAHLLAQWEILRPSDGVLLARGATDYRASGWVVNDYSGLVARLDQGLVVLTKDLIACLAQVGREPTGDRALPSTVRSAPIDCLTRTEGRP